MKNSNRISYLVEQLKEEDCDSIANVIESSMKACPEFGEEESTAEEFKDVMVAYLSKLTPDNFDHLVDWDSSAIVDQEKEQSNIVYQAKSVSRKLQIVGIDVVIAATVAIVILN